MAYNGFTNKETWTVNLWLYNEERLHETMVDLVRRYKVNKWPLPRRIQDFVYDLVLENQEGLAADLLSSSLAQVNWGEIADVWLEEAPTVASNDEA